jgi:hypothetical protein
MKKEYDFSKGERGKFYQPNIKLNLPVYLESDVAQFVQKYAKKKNIDRQTIVNELLRKDKELVESMS